ncbi:MAG: hypothetical protein LBU97_04915 [Alistipes sp.]|jgi:hypothetical protein|nr:hypothetical protein [Alistipes sp.]
MKTLNLLLLCGTTVILASCQPESGLGGAPTEPGPTPGTMAHEGDYIDDHAGRSHLVWLSFRDSEGDDLVEGLDTSLPGSGFVLPGQYSLSSLPAQSVLWPSQVPSAVSVESRGSGALASPDPLSRMIVIPPKQIDFEIRANRYYMLGLSTVAAPWYGEELDRIVYTMTCEYIFGDDDPHEIVTYWRDPSTPSPFGHRVCYRVDVDGEEQSEISYSTSECCSRVVVRLLDRQPKNSIKVIIHV